MSRFIIYGLVDPRTDEVRYIGQSSRGLRRVKEHGMQCHVDRDQTHKGAWIRSLHSSGLTYAHRILEEIESEEELNEAEIRWIAFGKSFGWPLTNHSDGGDGIRNPSMSTRDKLRRANLGKKHTKETRAKMSAAQMGRRHTDESRRRISEAHKGKSIHPETLAKLVAANTGRVASAESREKMSIAAKGKRKSEETRARMSASKTPELRAKVAAEARARWAAKRLASSQKTGVSL